MGSRAWQQIGAPTPSNGRKSGLFRMRAQRGRAYPEAARKRLKNLASLLSRSWARAESRVVQPLISPTAVAPSWAARPTGFRSMPARYCPPPSGCCRMPRVVIACCSTAAEIAVATAINSWMLCAIQATSPTAPWVAAWIAATAARFPRSRVTSDWPAPRKLLQNSSGAIVDIVVCEPSGQFGRDWRQRHRRTTIHWPEAAEIYGMNGCLSLNCPFRDKAGSH